MDNERVSEIRVGDTVRILRARNGYGQDVSKFSPKPHQIGETFVVGRVDAVGQDHMYPCPIVFPEGEALDFWRADDLLALRSPHQGEVEGLPSPADVTRWNREAEQAAYDRLAQAQGLQPSVPKAGEVTDEMVERACDCLFGHWRDRAPWTQERMKGEARAALTAALSGDTL